MLTQARAMAAAPPQLSITFLRTLNSRCIFFTPPMWTLYGISSGASEYMNCVFAVGLALIRSSFDYSPGVSEIEQCLLRRCAINIDCDLNLNAGSTGIRT